MMTCLFEFRVKSGKSYGSIHHIFNGQKIVFLYNAATNRDTFMYKQKTTPGLKG